MLWFNHNKLWVIEFKFTFPNICLLTNITCTNFFLDIQFRKGYVTAISKLKLPLKRKCFRNCNLRKLIFIPNCVCYLKLIEIILWFLLKAHTYQQSKNKKKREHMLYPFYDFLPPEKAGKIVLKETGNRVSMCYIN